MNMDLILRDLRHAFRGMFRDPGFTVVAVLTLALGIGVTTAVFSFTTALMSARIPGRDIDRVLGVWSSDRNDSQPRILVSPADFHYPGLEQIAIRHHCGVVNVNLLL